MALGMSPGFGNTMGGGAIGAVNIGPDLENIQTERLGFLGIAGDARVRVTSPWSTIPPATASLLSIASHKGLLAAAGPQEIVVAKTDFVRKAFSTPQTPGTQIRDFQPQLKIPMPTRISHLAFTADESHLIASAERGGGLAVYDVQSLHQGSTSIAFELSTNGEPLRWLLPNPTAEKAELCAIVTTEGNLYMANLRDRTLKNIQTQVSCVSWSTRGKQLCAGLANGTIHQMTPDGEGKGDIPKPPNIGNFHVASLLWLENHLFLAVHTATDESTPSSVYHIITRDAATSSFLFRKASDPVESFSSEKFPHHSFLRLKDFPPTLQDLLLVCSTASSDIGIFSRSQAPLASKKPADSINNVFTTTELLSEVTRPTLPMIDPADDSVPIGFSLDMSSADKVDRPIPSDPEVEESPGPLPILSVLTHEGVLCSWWIVYNDAVRQGLSYPGLAAIATETPAQQATQTIQAPALRPPGLSASAGPTFGSPAVLGQTSSPWGSAATAPSSTNPSGAAFGSSSFGNPRALTASSFGKPSAIAFGQASQLAMRTSPWTSGGSPAPAFGQSGFPILAQGIGDVTNNQSPGSLAAAPAAPPSSEKGFAAFANSGGFVSFAGKRQSRPSIFSTAGKTRSAPFTSIGSSGTSMDTAFPPKEQTAISSFPEPTHFRLQTSSEPAAPQPADNESLPTVNELSMFGSDFASNLKDMTSGTQQTSQKGEEMETETSMERQVETKTLSPFNSPSHRQSTTPLSTPAPKLYGLPGSPAPGSSLFGPATSLEEPATTGHPRGAEPNIGSKPLIKKEDTEDPLPPDTTSKIIYPIEESPPASDASGATNRPFGTAEMIPSEVKSPSNTISSAAVKPTSDAPTSTLSKNTQSDRTEVVEPAPLPPDFVTTSKAAQRPKTPDPPEARRELFPRTSGPAQQSPEQAPPLPINGSDEDEKVEDSGIDEAEELSPGTSGPRPTPGCTPRSSFGGDESLSFGAQSGGLEQSPKRPFLSRISHDAPILPHPSRTISRSPSPTRRYGRAGEITSEASRSVSAPGRVSRRVHNQQKGEASHLRRERLVANGPYLAQQHRIKERQGAAEAQPLIDEEDDQVQKILGTAIEGSLDIDEFIAIAHVLPPASDSVPAQVEAVYRDTNSMLDTFALNLRAVKAFTMGHSRKIKAGRRSKEDMASPEDWVLCEISELGDVMETELRNDLEEGRVQDLQGKLDACQEMARALQRTRAIQEDLKATLARLDGDGEGTTSRNLPLSAQQAAQLNDLRREYTTFTKLLNDAEQASILLKAKMASLAGPSSKENDNTPTLEAVIRTIHKLTSMAEKRSGDVDVLEAQLRKVRLDSPDGDDPTAAEVLGGRKSTISPDPSPSRSSHRSRSSSVLSMGGSGLKATPARRILSGLSTDEKRELLEKRARRRAVFEKLRSCVAKKGVTVMTMEDIE